MLVPYNVDVPMDRWPIANWVLIGVTIITSVFLWTSHASLIDSVVWRGDDFSITQLITYLFAHDGIIHLGGNMLFLFVFGNAVNAKLGHMLYLLLYAITGIIAALVWLPLGDEGVLLGASGAIMGVVGAFLVFYPRNDISVWYWFGFIAAGSFSVSSYWMILMYLGFDLWGFFARGDEGGVAYVSHLAGIASGFGLATLMLATRIIKPGEAEQTIFQALRRQESRKTRPPARKVAPGPSPMRPPPRPTRIENDAPIPLVGDEPAPAPRPRPPARKPPMQ